MSGDGSLGIYIVTDQDRERVEFIWADSPDEAVHEAGIDDTFIEVYVVEQIVEYERVYLPRPE